MIKFKNILQEEKILVPRHLEDRDEDYKRIVYKKIQDYIKKGSKGNLYFYKAPISKLPDNFTQVRGSLNLGESQIKSLNNLQIVGRSLFLQYTPIKSLGNLQKVGQSLYISDTSIESLGNLKMVGGSLFLRNTSLKSLGNLQEIWRDLYLDHSQVQFLGNLQIIGGSLYLKDSFFSKNYSKEEIIQIFKDKKIKIKGLIFV